MRGTESWENRTEKPGAVEQPNNLQEHGPPGKDFGENNR